MKKKVGQNIKSSLGNWNFKNLTLQNLNLKNFLLQLFWACDILIQTYLIQLNRHQNFFAISSLTFAVSVFVIITCLITFASLKFQLILKKEKLFCTFYFVIFFECGAAVAESA